MLTLPLLCHKGFESCYVSTELPAFIMGILNVTPDSFWNKSRFSGNQAAEMALQMISEGADIIDIGGESTRPGSEYVNADEELERIIPVIEQIRRHSECPVSVDTRKKTVIQQAHIAGADILNDISAMEDDSEIADYVSLEKLPVILMHKRGNPAIMQDNTKYEQPLKEVNSYLESRVEYALKKGISVEKIFLDPGIGFGKDLDTNIALIKGCSKFCDGKFPVVMGLSRKTCIGQITGRSTEERMSGTLAANLLAVQYGAKILRVHDVKQTRDMLCVLEKIGNDCT